MESEHGAEIYYLHEDGGFPIADVEQKDLTPLQRQFYLKAREYYNEKEQEIAEKRAEAKHNNI